MTNPACVTARPFGGPIRGQTAEARQGVRRIKSLPLVGAMKSWFEAELTRVPPRGGLADAIRYALTRWSALCRFLDDGRVELDTNTVERAVRMIAMHESLCGPSLSPCEHWKRILVGRATRATFLGKRGLHRVCGQIGRADLVGRSRYNLRGSKDIRPDQAADRMIRHAKSRGCFRHREPLPPFWAER